MRTSTGLTVAALVAALVLAALLYPAGGSLGDAFALVLGVPVLVTAVPVALSSLAPLPVARWGMIGAAGLLVLWAVASAASVGVFLLPVAALEGAAALVARDRRRASLA